MNGMHKDRAMIIMEIIIVLINPVRVLESSTAFFSAASRPDESEFLATIAELNALG